LALLVLGRVFRFGILVLALWTSVAVAGFGQGQASIHGTVTDTFNNKDSMAVRKTRRLLLTMQHQEILS
jgi:hypothetical protein